jgi:ATP-binding cassette, subfamily B (MDR/TAP), member 1
MNKDHMQNTSTCRLVSPSSSFKSTTRGSDDVFNYNNVVEDVVTKFVVDDDDKDNSKNEKKVEAPSFQRLLAMNGPEWKQTCLGCINAVLFGAIQPVYSFGLGSVISVYFLEDHDEIKRQIRIYALCFLGLAVISMVVNVLQHYSFAYMGEYLTKRVREKMFSKILTFEVGWFDEDQNSTGAICSRLDKEANVVCSLKFLF